MKKTLIFDFDGTVANSFDIFAEICEEIIKKYHFSKTNFDFKEEIRKKELKEIFKDFKISSFKLPFLVLAIRFKLKKQINEIKPYPDIKETLKKLKEKNFNLGILSSNSQKNISTFLKNNDLDDLFDFIFSEMSIFGKEKSLAKLVQKFNLEKKDIIYVGDETRDIEACKKFGVPIISVSWGFNDKKLLEKFEPDFLVEKVDDLIYLADKV